MAENLKDALVVVAASSDLGLFLDQGEEIKSLMDALSSIDVESLSDFRFAFVSDDKLILRLSMSSRVVSVLNSVTLLPAWRRN